MKIIYEPTGKAKEYADLALNIYKGCTHKCRYCYCANSRYLDKDEFFSKPNPKKNIISRITSDCELLVEKYNGPERVPEILMSFLGDVYQPAEEQLGLTRHAIEVLTSFNLRFTILTKGGMLAERDFDLLNHYPGFRLGISLSVIAPSWVKMYEPGSADPEERIHSCKVAREEYGIKTWCSLEPIIDPQQALWILKEWHSEVDFWYLGRITYPSSDAPRWSTGVDWIATRDLLASFLESVGASHKLKKSFSEEQYG